MKEPESADSAGSAEGPTEEPEGVGDALRAAVERTLAATADSATETRQRAQSLLDDVVRRGQVAREEVTRRGEKATTRLAEAIGDRRPADGEALDDLAGRVAQLERRLARVEGLLGESNPEVEDEGKPADPHGQRDSEG